MTKKQSPRQEALVKAAKARALITSFLNGQKEPVTPDRILPVLHDLGYDMAHMMPLIDRMCISDLLTRVNVIHPDYKYGYLAGKVVEPRKPEESLEDKAEPFAKRAYTKRQQQVKDGELPLDIRINEADQTLTIRAMGLRITIGKE